MLKAETIKAVLKEYAIKQENNKGLKTIELYHGTTVSSLYTILKEGILPNKTHNWVDEKAVPNKDMVYLTNKWHYFYAYNAVEMNMKKMYGDDWEEKTEGQWWINQVDLPVYIKVEVPISLLRIDEDLAYSPVGYQIVKNFETVEVMDNKIIGNGDTIIDIDWKHSLAVNGTVAFKGNITLDMIREVTILKDPRLYLELMDENKQYKQELDNFFNCRGIGTLTLKELMNIEKKYIEVGKFKPHREKKVITKLSVEKDGTLNKIYE